MILTLEVAEAPSWGFPGEAIVNIVGAELPLEICLIWAFCPKFSARIATRVTKPTKLCPRLRECQYVLVIERKRWRTGI